MFGLAFFALLLTQINNVSDIMSETAKVEKDIKDGVLQFLKNQDLDEELIADTVRHPAALRVGPRESRSKTQRWSAGQVPELPHFVVLGQCLRGRRSSIRAPLRRSEKQDS